MKIVDLGCGRKKIEGSIGVDFSSLSDADISLDLNTEKLPFENDSIDYFFSSHTLEHLTVEGFLNVISEVYRCLKPSGQFLLLVPYYQVDVNFANIFHNNQIAFNEHTFRFFSSSSECLALDKEDYQTAGCPHWGLRYSANSELAIEFETIAINFYYFREFEELSQQEKRMLRRKSMNVVEQISYHLKPIKPCPVRPETGPIDDDTDKYAYIDGQIDYLIGQVDYIKHHIEPHLNGPSVIDSMLTFVDKHKSTLEAYKKVKQMDKTQIYRRQGELFIDDDGLLFPPGMVIMNLQSKIDQFQQFIDQYVVSVTI
ncbi:class I SAM-dependent methyltransferase [Pseudoalteromonas sp. XMcav1-K]|uniref:class I SAM-dependent methyltransferase n=1 Tax=Pseudoalteromonas sp. XMcav1-K TaxID=3374372 RepID=UPI0037578918